MTDPRCTHAEFLAHLAENGWEPEEIATMRLPTTPRTESQWEALIRPYQSFD